MTPLFSANTGFLWTDHPLAERIRRAARAGFDAVEFHDEAQHADPAELAEVLAETGLPVLGLNVQMGATAGCAALPGQETAARRGIDAAAEVAARTGARAIHVLAGRTDAPGAAGTYRANLRHALAATDRIILIEPICAAAMPGYHLSTIEQAAGVLADIDHPRLKILFDWFHVETGSGDAMARFAAHAPAIGHVQIAAIPTRSEPEPEGHLPYARLIPAMRSAGYGGAFGCEYRPAGATVEEGLAWMPTLRAAARPTGRAGDQ